jgi:hypothetical protein
VSVLARFFGTSVTIRPPVGIFAEHYSNSGSFFLTRKWLWKKVLCVAARKILKMATWMLLKSERTAVHLTV